MLFQGVAASTRRVYKSHQVHYDKWCKASKLRAWPLNWKVLAYYMTDRSRSVSVATLKVANAALASEALDRGYTNDMRVHESL